MRPWSAVSFLSLSASTAMAQSCDYYNKGDNCINVHIKGTKSFEFKPLFPEDPTLVYAVDELSKNEIQMEIDQGYMGNTDVAQRTTFWLEHSNMNDTEEAMSISQIGMLFTNASGAVYGGNNGCDGLLGEECVENLKDVLKWNIIRNMRGDPADKEVLAEVFRDLKRRPMYNLSCPHDLFDDEALRSDIGALAVETFKPEKLAGYAHSALASGNSTYTYADPVDHERSYEEQLRKIGVGIITRFPITLDPVYNSTTRQDEGGRNTTFEAIQMELVCLRAGDGNSASTNNTGIDGEEEGSESLATPITASLARVMATVMVALVVGSLVSL